MSKVRVNPNAEVGLRAAVRPALVAAAQAARSRVEAEKHSVMPRHRSGSVVVDFDLEDVRVVNTDHGAHIDEYGSVTSPAYAPLRRGTRAAGLRLKEHGA